MNTEKIKDITEQLEQGVKDVFESEKYRSYLDVMSRFYNYSAGNCILIVMQCPGASLIAGFKAWQKKFNRHVKKGEKAIKILAPCLHKIKKEDENGEEKEITFTTFKAAYVFDVSQTEGADLPTMCSRLTDSVDGYADLLETIKEASPVPVRFDKIEGGASGYFHTINKEIVIREGMSESQTIKTLVHEISHAILHDKETGEEKDAARHTAEVQAESVAYTVCQYIGLDTSEYSFEYVAGWAESREVKDLTNSLEVIRKTAKEIIEMIAA